MKFLIISLFFTQFLIGQNLKPHIWKERVLIISGNIDAREMIEKQFNQFRYKTQERSQRKLVVYKCIENNCTIYDWNTQPRVIKTEQAFKDFKISLIGLDGEEKYKTNTIVNPDFIFSSVDRMPMRQVELKHNKNE